LVAGAVDEWHDSNDPVALRRCAGPYGPGGRAALATRPAARRPFSPHNPVRRRRVRRLVRRSRPGLALTDRRCRGRGLLLLPPPLLLYHRPERGPDRPGPVRRPGDRLHRPVRVAAQRPAARPRERATA